MGISFESSIVPLAGRSVGTTGCPRFQKLIESTTYRPFTQLVLIGYADFPEAKIDGVSLFPGSRFQPARLSLRALVQNSYDPEQPPSVIEFTQMVPEMIEDYDDNYQKVYLRCFLENWEMHESAEWFKIDGKVVNDPHAKENAR